MKTINVNGLTIPSCAVGTWGWGGGINSGKMIFGDTPKETILHDCFTSAVKNGLLLFDTAAIYGGGSSEKLIGKFSIDCDDIIISTKFTPIMNQSSSAMEKTLNKSLKRLKREYVDIYWLHNTVNLSKNLESALSLLKSGKIKNLGLSNCCLSDIEFAEDYLNNNGYHIFGVQNHYSLLYTDAEKSGILRWCHENNSAFFAYMVLEQGILAGKKDFTKLSRRGISYTKETIKKISPLVNLLKEIGAAHGLSSGQAATAWAISKGIQPIIGARSPSQIGELRTAADVTLGSKEIYTLEATAKKIDVEVRASWEKRIV